MRTKSIGNSNAQKYHCLEDVLRNTRSTETGCMEWLGAVNKDGYAAVSVGGIFTGQLLHREVLRLSTGMVPQVVMHQCDNRLCVNPTHLQAGTAQDNVLDMDTKGRRAVGSRNGNSRFTDAQIATMVKDVKSGVPQRSVCEQFGVSRGYLWKLLAGKYRA